MGSMKGAPFFMKKLTRFMSSMKFAIILLILIGLVSIVGTLIPQGKPDIFYQEQYSGIKSNLIMLLNINDVYHSWWYVALNILLCLSLLFCVVGRISPLIESIKHKGLIGNSKKIGSWLLHFGLILLIIFFGLNTIYAKDGIVYDVPGEIADVKEHNLLVEFVDFDIPLKDGQYVDQYKTTIRIYDTKNNLLEEGTVEVNHPMKAKGVQFTQSSYGYAVDVAMKTDNKDFGSAILYKNDYVVVPDEEIAIELVQFYPDYHVNEGAVTSGQIINPHVLYRFYIGKQLADMQMVSANDTVMIGEYEIKFSNPRMYSVLSTRTDPFIVGVAIGALLMFLGTAIVFLSPDKKDEKENKVVENT